MPIRLGAVSYLNARPLVRGLAHAPERFALRFDVPSRCAALLHAGEIDLGLIPSIEYLAGDYRVVPGIGVVSEGPVASVALFSRVAVADIRTIALDTSSRTSVALLKVLCARHFGIASAYAALLIGEPALLAPYEAFGLRKIDLGASWTGMTGLPFLYAFWAGPPGVVTPADVVRLQEARDEGRQDSDLVAAEYFAGDPGLQGYGAAYLRKHIRYDVGERERAGVERFFALAADVGAAPPARGLRFYEGPDAGQGSPEPAAAGAVE